MNSAHALIVFLGAGAGGVLRWLVNTWGVKYFDCAFPWSTLIVNVSGSTIMGILGSFFLNRYDGEAWRLLQLFIFTGILGGYTTFSAFSLEALMLWNKGEAWAAIGYVLGSVFLGLSGAAFGYWMVHDRF